MYLPPFFRVTDPALAQPLIQEQPLASLVTTDDDGLPFVTHLPLRLERGWGRAARYTCWGTWPGLTPSASTWRCDPVRW